MADTDQVLNLAAIIRKVDGNHSKGAAALAESILDHPNFRAVLARWGNSAPTPVDGEVAELVAWLQNESHHHDLIGETLLRRAAELLQREVLVPVSVSERLPGPEYCDAKGRCWWWYPSVPDKTYGYWAHEDDAIPERAIDEQPTHWLPAHALPLPEVGE